MGSIVSSSKETPISITNKRIRYKEAAVFLPKSSGRYWNPPWWNRRTRMERFLCGVAVIALVMFAAMAVALAIVGYQYQRTLDSRRPYRFSPSASRLVNDGNANGLPDGNVEVCLTPGCVKAAARLLQNMDPKVDPCDDFYSFACGGWIEQQAIPDDKSSLSVFSLLQDDLNIKLRALVEKSEPSGEEPDFIEKMKNMYHSCMNLSTIESLGTRPLRKVLRDLGGWPVVEGYTWRSDQFDWLDTLIKFRHLGFSHDILLDLSVTPDFRNNTRHIVDLDQTALGMPDRNYLLKGLNDSAVAAYYKLMVESAVLLGADRGFAERELLDALQFEITLANYSVPREERRNISKLYNKMQVWELQQMAPQIPWLKYFNSLLLDPISENEPVIVNVPRFVRRFAVLISNSDPRVVANYMIWRVILQTFNTLGKKWRELAQDYQAVITGQTREEPRWEQCMGSLTGSLGVALASLYVKNNFREDSKETALEMVRYIHREFLKIIDEIDWMDEKTRERARAKAHTIQSYIGYPDEILDNGKLSDLYEKLQLGPDDYFTNVQNLRKWSTDYAFSQLRKPNNKGDWKKHARAAVVNAYYNALENSIEFPAGILQGAFFSRDRPSYLNFGAIGFVIGHEITHGFDDRGRQFDKDGNNVNWWEVETDTRFKKRAQCIIEQYGNYTVPENGLKINGINTQGENIADNGGLKEAFRAYLAWARDNGEEPALPGLNYTPMQLFWISAANVWCGKYRPEVLKLRVLSGSHSPSMFRVIGPFSNIEEFSQVFKCPVGSRMNPENKCSVW